MDELRSKRYELQRRDAPGFAQAKRDHAMAWVKLEDARRELSRARERMTYHLEVSRYDERPLVRGNRARWLAMWRERERVAALLVQRYGDECDAIQRAAVEATRE